jgi:hypothetical protein
MTRYQASLTQADVHALCLAAKQAWQKAPGRARRVPFVWRKKRFIVRHTSFRLFVHEANGQPVAYAWD